MHQWMVRDLCWDQWLYLWVDGIYSGLRCDDAKLCALVVIGVNERSENRVKMAEIMAISGCFWAKHGEIGSKSGN